MEVDINAVPLAEPEHQVTRDPELVSGALGALAEDLEFPLSLRDFGVDALDCDAGRDAEVDVLVDDLPSDVADVLVADTGVVLALRPGKALLRESERRPVLVEEVLLLEAEPGVGVVCDRGAAVRRVWGSVREKHLTHDEAGEEGGAGFDAVPEVLEAQVLVGRVLVVVVVDDRDP